MSDARKKLYPSGEFALEENEDGRFFVHHSGQKVQTDALGCQVWKNLPGEAGLIIDSVRTKMLASPGFLEQYLFVLLNAGIIRADHPRKNQEPEAASTVSEERRPGRDRISAIVVTYNGEPHVRECLESLLNQTYDNLEILIVDNASKDATVSILQDSYPQVRLLALKKNRHFARAVNHGIGHAEGKYFLVLNQDVVLEKDCLANLHRLMRSGEKVGAAVPMMKFYHLRSFVNGIGNHIRNTGWGSDNFIGLVDVGQFKELKEVPSACFGAVLLDADAVADVGKLDGGFGSFYEDVDWSFRSWFRGWKIVPAPDAVLYHKFGGSYPQGEKLRFVVRNRIRLVLKIFQGRIMFGFLKRYLKEDLGRILSFMKQNKFGGLAIHVQSYLSLLLSLPMILVQRGRIFRRKRKGVREEDVLAKNPAFFSGLNDAGQPIVDASMIFGYYRWEIPLRSKIETEI